MQNQLAEKAVLMRLSIGLPGENRQDKPLSDAVKSEHRLGAAAGKWVKQLYPPEALEPIKKLDNEARAYFDSVTLPFDKGIGILPAGLIVECGDKMREFAGRRAVLVTDHFLAKFDSWVDWARAEHNGTFDPELYDYQKASESFYFKTCPLPVPDSGHFASTVSSLLGLDAESVNVRVADAVTEAQRELMRRMIDPVKAMAAKLTEQPKLDKATGLPKDDIVFRDSLVGNVKEIVALAPKLNIAGDPAIDSFVKEMEALTVYSPKDLREDKGLRSAAAETAAAVLKRLEGYKL